MKYHGHKIIKVKEDLGEDDPRLNFIYEIYDEKGNYLLNALTLWSAKEYIDSGHDERYL